MRKKVIRAFLGVYLAICVTYGVVRGVTMPAMAEDVPVTDVPPEQTTAEPMAEPKAELEEMIETPAPTPTPYVSASGEASYSGRRGRGRGRLSGSLEMGDPSGETFAYEPAAPSVSSPSAASSVPEDADEADEEEKTSQDAAPAAAVPTLQEYLKNLHCGGCGRNCFLLNPHCMRGARKENQAESAYYAQYGEAAADGYGH